MTAAISKQTIAFLHAVSSGDDVNVKKLIKKYDNLQMLGVISSLLPYMRESSEKIQKYFDKQMDFIRLTTALARGTQGEELQNLAKLRYSKKNLKSYFEDHSYDELKKWSSVLPVDFVHRQMLTSIMQEKPNMLPKDWQIFKCLTHSHTLPSIEKLKILVSQLESSEKFQLLQKLSGIVQIPHFDVKKWKLTLELSDYIWDSLQQLRAPHLGCIYGILTPKSWKRYLELGGELPKYIPPYIERYYPSVALEMRGKGCVVNPRSEVTSKLVTTKN